MPVTGLLDKLSALPQLQELLTALHNSARYLLRC